MLRGHSPYFAASLKEGWNNGEEPQTTYLEEARPDGFSIVVHWIYEKWLPSYNIPQRVDQDDDDDDEEGFGFPGVVPMRKTYKLAKFLLIHDLANALTDADHEDSRVKIAIYTLEALSDISNDDLGRTPLYQMALHSYCETVAYGQPPLNDERKKDLEDFE